MAHENSRGGFLPWGVFQNGGWPWNGQDDDAPPCTTPTTPGAAVIPAAFAGFVGSLPSAFTQAFEAAAIGGAGWLPVVLAGVGPRPLAAPYPVALFSDFTMAPSQPLLITGGNTVGLINDSSVAVTVSDTATTDQYIATGSGGMTLLLGSESGMFVAEGGNNVVVAGAGQTGGWSFDLLGGTNQLWLTSGNDTVQTAAGSSNLVVFGSGTGVAVSGGTDIFFGGTGADTITATGSNISVVGGSGDMTVIEAGTVPGGQSAMIFGGAGFLSVQGGLGSLIVATGSGGGDVTGGAAGGNLLYGGGAGATLAGGGNGDYLIAGPAGGDQLTAGSGNETLVGGTGGGNTLTGGTGNDVMVLGGGANTVVGGSAGSEVVWAGSGNTSLTGGAASLTLIAGLAGNATVQAGSGSALFTFINGQAGGTTVINNFNPGTDSINLIGYAANSDTVASSGGSTMITLADNTQIQLIGLASLPGSAII